MTIIKPNQHKNYIRFLVKLFILVLIGGVFYIFEYNSLVNTRHKLRILKNNINTAEVLNSDLENALYQMVDPADLELLAKDKQLILERAPEYLPKS